MNLRARSLILVVFGLIVIFSSSKTTQARNQGQSLESPPPTVTTSDITGNWIGFLTQPGGLFSFELSLTQNGSTIQGTSTIRTTGGHYGVMSLNGSISDSTVYLDEIQIIDTSPTPGFRWCIKTLNLTVSSFQSISTLAGNWQDPGCSSGIVQLQRSTDPFIQVGGSWLGTLIQPGTYFSFELDLTQSGSNITGTSTIRNGSGYGIMQLVGFLAGNSLIFHETRIIDSNRSYWCIKILNLTYTNTGSAVDLNGTWSAPGCTGGSLSVQKQLPAVTYSISGKVTDENGSALSGVTMSTNSGINTVTNPSGVYTFTSLIASTYVLTPIKSGYHFTPNSQVVDVPPDKTGQDFVGTPVYTISGRVTDENLDPLPGVTISAGPGSSATTDPTSGLYTITGLVPGTYILTPTNIGQMPFSPVTRTVNIPPDATKQDFTMPFLDFPISYTNFALATLGVNEGNGYGRVHSWFDHQLPYYTDFNFTCNPREGNPIQHNDRLSSWFSSSSWTGSNVCDCTAGVNCYDGHNGLDIAPPTDRSQGEYIFAAATGVVTNVVTNSNVGYGNRVWIDHGNGYATLYGHLEVVFVQNGDVIHEYNLRSQPIGFMGSTGNSSGIHLHFGLYFDRNNDGNFRDTLNNNTEAVDPYGWWNSMADTWAVGRSALLWKHPLVSSIQVDSSGGSLTSRSNLVNVSIPPSALNTSVTIELLDAPPPAPSGHPFRSSGTSFWIRVLEWIAYSQLNSGIDIVSNDFTQPIVLNVAYGDEQVKHLDISQLTVFHWDDINNAWLPLPSNTNFGLKQVTAQTTKIGQFDLQAPLLCPSDTFEFNDNYIGAKFIPTDGSPNISLFDITEDEDWFKAELKTGVTYTLETTNLATGVDTILELYDTDGISLIASNDNNSGGLASLIEWQAAADNVYFLRVFQTPTSTNGCGASYELMVSETSTEVIYLPIIVK